MSMANGQVWAQNRSLVYNNYRDWDYVHQPRFPLGNNTGHYEVNTEAKDRTKGQQRT